MKNNKWKRISALLLAVCMIASLMLSGNVPGVFALEDTESADHITVEENIETQESAEVSGDSSDAEYSAVEKNAEIDETASEDWESIVSDEAVGTSETFTENGDLAVPLDANETQTAVQADIDNISELIDADIALLKWKAVGSTAEITLDGTTYQVTDNASYQTAYTQVYNALLAAADIITENLPEQTITQDTIWNINSTISMTGNINVSSNSRLVILGTGTITKTSNYNITVNGSLCLQGNVYLNGNQSNSALVYISSGTVYLADNFHLGNNNANGITADGGTIYMVGGLIGTTDISFEWYNDDNARIDTKNYAETLSYIKSNLSSEEYNYINQITATGGNIKGIQLSKTAQLYFSDGVIAGNGNLSSNNGTGITAVDASQIVMTGGIIMGNQTGSSGGGLNINCTAIISGGLIAGNYSSTYAGGINMGGTLDLKGDATIAFNSCYYNGGAVLISQKAICTMEEQSAILHNRAIGAPKNINNSNTGKGGAFRVVGTLVINSGKINYNSGNGPIDSGTVNQDVGGAISAQTDVLDPGKPTEAIRVATVTLNGGEMAYNKAKGRGGAIWTICGAKDYNATFKLNGTKIHDNKAASDGGAIYLSARAGTLKADIASGSLSNNVSQENGGGIYLELTSSGKELTVNIGSESQSSSLDVSGNKANSFGGGLYIARIANTTGTSNINLYNGTLKANHAQQGGAIGIVQGNLNIYGGKFENNTAEENGGGVYVADGKVRMFGGNLTDNTAGKDGGGLYVSSKTAADVVIRSGNIANNTANGNGGGIAVVSDNTNSADLVTIGLLETHQKLDVNTDARGFEAFEYTDLTDNVKHTHSACPVLEKNTAVGNGGGIYMGSSAAQLNIYCLTESGNSSRKNANGAAAMATGGKVVIGDSEKNNKDARGNIVISSPLLIEGGDVDIYGNMKNPLFKNNVLVDIQTGSGNFDDHRVQASDSSDKQIYKVHYFENFKESDSDTATGLYTAIQYSADQPITAESSLFSHIGWEIIGWAKSQNATSADYNIGVAIGNKDDHIAWNQDNINAPLVLYAVWQRISYTVEFNPNANNDAYSGKMSNQKFTYNVPSALSENAYSITGKRFTGWNTQADGKGTAYAADYSESKISAEKNSKVVLYAQWADCTHFAGTKHPGEMTYSAESNVLKAVCDCGIQSTAAISGVTVYSDGKAHPATVTYSNNTLLSNLTVSYQYKASAEETYGDMSNGEAVPTSVGYYKASITAGDKTASVEYQIKNPTSGIAVESKAAKGQKFVDFNGSESVSISQDDAFTMQFDIKNLNTAVYKTEPELSFSKALSSGTTIIMQADSSYWYYKVDGNSVSKIKVTEFTQMGGNNKFVYKASGKNQNYQFIVDFSKAKQSAETNTVTLSYSPTDSTVPLSGKVTVTSTVGSSFALRTGEGELKVNAPDSTADNRWNDRKLLLVLQAPDNIPADAKLTVESQQTSKYSLNKRKQFIVPLEWSASQNLKLSLNSNLALSAGQSYALTAKLYVSTEGQQLMDISCNASIALKVPENNMPSLRLIGTKHLFSDTSSETLDLSISKKNVDGCTIDAVIQQKQSDGSYSGNFLTVNNITEGEKKFSLAAIKTSGSYRLNVTVTENGQQMLEVPYYFIVQ